MLSDHTLKIHNNNFIYKLSEIALLFVIGGYVLVSDIVKATLRLGMTDQWEKYVIYAMVPTILFRFLVVLLQEKEERKTWFGFIAAALIVDAVYLMTYHEQHNQTVIFIAALTLGTIGLEYSKILKAYILGAVAVLFPAIILAWAGEIENYVYVREMTIRSSWGIKYPTDLMSLLFFLCLATWVVAKKKNDLWFLVPGGILTVMAYSVADSRTGVLCSVMLMIVVCISYLLSHRRVTILCKSIEICACAAFPAFTVLMNALMFAYRTGNPIAVRVNGAMSNRLALAAQALNDYGLSLFGKPIPQVGHGGSAFLKPDYYFIDTSYNLILLQFGIVTLILINILWVMMTRKAFRIGDTRLGLALAMVAFNSITEHHIMQPNYDVFIIMPFAILAAPEIIKEKPHRAAHAADEPRSSGKNGIVQIAAAAAIAAVTSAIFLMLLPMARTAFAVLDIEDRSTGRKLTWLICVAGVFLTIFILHAMFVFLTDREKRKKPQNVKYIALFTTYCMVLAAGTIYANNVIDRGAEKYADMVASEKEAIEIVNSSKSGKFYVSDLPSVYYRTYGSINTSLFNSEELAKYNNVSVIMDIHTDSPCFFNTGFLYTPISDKHALFTNDRSVSEALQNKGYHLTAYYPELVNVDMQDEAKRNKLEQNDDGSITLKGEKKKLRKGPRADLRAGRYTFTYDLTIDEGSLNNKAQNPDGVCRLKVTYYKGKYLVSEVTVNYDQFDENGNAHIEQLCDMPDAENTDIKILPIGNNVITIKGISYRKTPEQDIHSIYDSNRIKVREEYYDLDGNPDEYTWGYFAKDLGHDSRGNINHEIYYDQSEHKTLNKAGYCEIKRMFNRNNLDVHEEYFGTSGERILLPTGQSATTLEYDAFGRLTELTYYDAEDKPVLYGEQDWGGYHKIVMTLDDAGRIIREDYFGTEGEPVLIREGYAAREFGYDENGNIKHEQYYDCNGEKITGRNGYCEVRKQYNNNNQVVREEYYGEKGERVTLSDGKSAAAFGYDMQGCLAEISYFDIHDEPTLVGGQTWGGYHKTFRTYDEAGRIIREEYFDKDDRLVVTKGGYAVKTIEYDNNDNIVKEIYYDQNNERMLIKQGYCEIRKEYDSKNREIRESYYGIEGDKLNLPPGQASLEFKYEKKGPAYELLYYDRNNEPVMIGGSTWGGYHKVIRKIDQKNRIIREDYYDISGDLVTLKEGYASREAIYDNTNSVIGYHYYDKNGNLVRID